MSQAASGDWIVSPHADITAADLRRGIAALDHELQGGPGEAIAAALMELVSLTSRPPWMDDAFAAAYMDTMPKAMWDYPIDVVRGACQRWRMVPQHGKWWPNEQDLRAQCEQLFASRRNLRGAAQRLLVQLERDEQSQDQHASASASAFASAKAASFRAEMRKAMSPARFAAYFHPSEIAFEGDDTILVRTRAALHVMGEECADAAKQCGVRIVYAPQKFMGVKQPTRDDDTPAERAETARKFKRLAGALASGESIALLRQRGEV